MKKQGLPPLTASLWLLKFERRYFSPAVKRGAKIKEGQLLGIRRQKKAFCFNLARRLQLKPKKDLTPFLLVSFGQVVKAGTLLARRRRLFRKQLLVFAPRDGQIKPHRRPGWICLHRLEEKKVRAPLNGQLVSLTNKQLTVKFQARVFGGKTKFSGRRWGRLFRLEVNSFLALPKLEGNILLLVAKPTAALLAKAHALGVRAIVSRQDYHPPRPTPLPIFLTEAYNALLKLVDHPALLDGKGQQLLVCQIDDENKG